MIIKVFLQQATGDDDCNEVFSLPLRYCFQGNGSATLEIRSLAQPMQNSKYKNVILYDTNLN